MVGKIKEKRTQILVTGSEGMLGKDLCRELSDSYNVVGIDLKNGPGSFEFDITSLDDWNEIDKKIKADLVIHTAAWTNVDECENDSNKAKNINEIGAGLAAAYASKHKISIVYISTDFVFDGKKKSPYTENDKPSPLSVYAESKLGGENSVIDQMKKGENPKEYSIIRSGWLYGENGNNFVDTILKTSKEKKKIEVVSDQIGTPTYTKDLAKAIKKLIDNGKHKSGGIYHISNKGEVSWCDYAKEILKLAGIEDVEIIPVSSEKLGRPAKRPSYSVLDNEKFEKDTGYKMRPWKEALKEYINGKK